MPHLTTESARAAGKKRWEGFTPEQRREAVIPATKGRGRIRDVADQVDQLGTDILAELRALRSEVAELRAERTAA